MTERDALVQKHLDIPRTARQIRHLTGLSHIEVYESLVAMENSGKAYVWVKDSHKGVCRQALWERA